MSLSPVRDDAHRVAVLAYEKLCLFEFATALDLLRDRGEHSPSGWYQLATVSLEGAVVSSDTHVPVQVATDPELLLAADTIVVPGWRMEPVPDSIRCLLQRAHRQGARVVSICTGAFVLAAAGLLEGRRATTHWKYASEFSALHPNVSIDPSVLYIDEGDVLTSAGASAGIDMLLHMVRKDFGSTVSNVVARMMVTPPHREGRQMQLVEAPVPPQPRNLFANVIEHLRRHPGEEHTIESLAQMAAMSPRTFFRRFRAVTGHTPHDWMMMERTRLAKAMLEETDLSVATIAETMGFNAVDTFRHHFRRLVGTTPSRFRSTRTRL
ncbi:MAG TPA: helix-turn-helix domain-containing protein [Steroidobacter sp.]|nr:helix-turn-helix domain-containing protein [Steroidobacter sp.]